MTRMNGTYKSLRFFGGLDPKYPRAMNRQVISPEFLAFWKRVYRYYDLMLDYPEID